MRIAIFCLLLAQAGLAIAGAWAPWGPSGLPQVPIGIAAHPRTPGVLLAATALSSSGTSLVTHRSTDGGATWPEHSTVAGAYGQTRDLRLAMAQAWSYLTFGSRYARSQDGAVTWTPLDGGAQFENTLIGVNPDNGAELVVYRAAGQALLHSFDAGTTWTSIAVPAIPVGGTVDWSTRTLYILPPQPGSLLIKALDSGTVWTPGPSVGDVAALGGKAIASGYPTILHSPDHGTTWQPVQVNGANFGAVALAYAPTQPQIAYAIEGGQAPRVARSVDGGATFNVVGSIDDSSGALDVAVEAGAGDRLIASFRDAVYRSIDGGATWQPLARAGDFPTLPAQGVLFDATNPSLRYVRGFALRSLDAGATWLTLPEANEEPLYPIATSPTRSGLAFAQGSQGTFGPTLHRTLDSGATWQPVGVSLSRYASNLMILPGDAPSEYFLSASVFVTVPPLRAAIWRSTDEGATWTGANAPPYEILSLARASGTPLVLYAGVAAPVGVAGLYRSVDHAASWQAIVTGDTSGPVTAIAVDPSNRDRVFVAYGPASPNDSARLVRSTDGGATWTTLWIAMPSTTITALAVDPANGQRVFAGTSTQGVFASADAGATWSALDEKLSDHRIAALDVDPRDASKRYASTQTGPYVADLSTGLPAGHRWAIEYYHAAFEHYFVSADADEIAGLDAGVFAGWARTGESFRVGPTPSPDQAPVCRFFGVGFAPLSSHFYTPYPDECETVKRDPKWLYEKIAFGLRLPEANKGCLPGYAPLFRTWNRNRGGAPNHRYTTNHVTFQTMVQMGWVMEGEASTFAFACVPQ
jgi:photosystem II stability/assembly factor-like uncharacterized protein